MKKWVVIAVAMVGFFGCAFNQSETDPNRKRDMETREKLRDSYQDISGVYEGEYVQPARTELVRLTLSFRETPAGRDADGNLKYQPELTARFTRLERNLFDSVMTAGFVPETADLTLTTNSGGGEYFYIRGTLSNGEYAAPVKDSQGRLLGYINLKYTNKEVKAPDQGEANETYDRLRRPLEPFTGKWMGHLVRHVQGWEDMDFEFLVRVEDFTAQDGTIYPRLVSYSRPTNGFSTVGKHLIDYNTDRTPHEFTFNPVQGAKGYGDWQMKGLVINNEIRGQASFPTFEGSFVIRKLINPEK